MTIDPNSFDQELKDAQNANPENLDKGTEGNGNPNNPAPGTEQVVDYQKKFSESSREAQRLIEENKKLEADLAEKERLLSEKGSQELAPGEITELYPGFEQLDPEAQENLIKFTNNITKKAQAEILKDPAIAYSRSVYSEKRWDDAFDSIVQKYPELKDNRDDFKVKYYKPGNVPANIENILEDISKIYLFDKAKEIGAREAKAKEERIELERATGGDKTPTSARSLSDWQRMAQENPAKFASLSKEYQADLQSGKLKE